MLHQGRVGSTLLGNMLKEHPRITWRNELITFHRMHYERMHGSNIGWTCSPTKVINAARRNAPWGWFGCEVKPYNAYELGITLEEMVDQLKSMGFKRFIVLERRNLLRRYISVRMARASGKWHISDTSQRDNRSIKLDPESNERWGEKLSLLDVLRKDANENEQLLELARPFSPLHLIYEDHLQNDPSVGYGMVCEHLGEQPLEAQPNVVRTNPYPVSQLVSNYDEIAEVLAGTEFEWMLKA